MAGMITLALTLNLAVLIPVCASLLFRAPWVRAAYGEPSPARGILLSIYLAILLLSGALLWWRDPGAARGLLLTQIVYKLSTPLTVGTLRNPVVLSNLGIAAFHALSLLTDRSS
jgi:hypothetical protein